MTDTQPFADERLAEIEARHADADNGEHDLSLSDLDIIFGQHADLRVLLAEIRRLRAVEAAAYAFAEEMGDYCSPHGVAAGYAKRLRERLDDAKGNQR